jgi:hypothetical protein
MPLSEVAESPAVPHDLVRRIAEWSPQTRSSLSALAPGAKQVRIATSTCSCYLQRSPIQAKRVTDSMPDFPRPNGYRCFDQFPFRKLSERGDTVLRVKAKSSMNVRPEVVEVLRRWVRKAEHDLEAASRIMAIEEGFPSALATLPSVITFVAPVIGRDGGNVTCPQISFSPTQRSF